MLSSSLFNREVLAKASVEEVLHGTKDKNLRKLRRLAKEKGLTFPLMNEHEIRIGGFTRQLMLEMSAVGKAKEAASIIEQAQRSYGYQHLSYAQRTIFGYLGTIHLPLTEGRPEKDNSIIMHLTDTDIVSQVSFKNAVRYAEKEIWLMRKNLPEIYVQQILNLVDDKDGPGLMPSKIVSIANFDVDAHVNGPAREYVNHEIGDDFITIIHFNAKTTPSSQVLEEIQKHSQ